MDTNHQAEYAAKELADSAMLLQRATEEAIASLYNVANEWAGEARSLFIHKAAALGDRMTQEAEKLVKTSVELQNKAVRSEEE